METPPEWMFRLDEFLTRVVETLSEWFDRIMSTF